MANQNDFGIRVVVVGEGAPGNATGTIIPSNGAVGDLLQYNGLDANNNAALLWSNNYVKNTDLANLQYSIVPANDSVYTLGNSTNQWKSLYVSGNTVYINNYPLAVDANGHLLFDNVHVVTSANGTDVNLADYSNTALMLANDTTTYTNGVIYTDEVVSLAYNNATAYADQRYIDAVNAADGLATNAFVNAVAYVVNNDFANVAYCIDTFPTYSVFYSTLGSYTTHPELAANLAAVNTYINQQIANVSSNSQTYTDQRYIDAVNAADGLAANAYANAIAYAANGGGAANAYTNAIAVAALLADNAYSNAIAYASNTSGAANAYTNAVAVATLLAENAYSNATAYADVASNSAYTAAITVAIAYANLAYTNSVAYTNQAVANVGGGIANGANVNFNQLTVDALVVNNNITSSANLTISAKDAETYTSGSSLLMNAGAGLGGGWTGGVAVIQGGAGRQTAAPGPVQVAGGTAESPVGFTNGGIASIQGGTSWSGIGGDVYIDGGDANTGNYGTVHIGENHTAEVHIGTSNTLNINASANAINIIANSTVSIVSSNVLVNNSSVVTVNTIANSTSLGVVSVDGVTILAAANGQISANVSGGGGGGFVNGQSIIVNALSVNTISNLTTANAALYIKPSSDGISAKVLSLSGSTGQFGGPVVLGGGTSSGNGQGGAVQISAGGGATSNGGPVIISGGTGYLGGSIDIFGGSSSNGVGGSASLYGGQSTSGQGGTTTVFAGSSLIGSAPLQLFGGRSTQSDGGQVAIIGGNTAAVGQVGGTVSIVGGYNQANAISGDVNIFGNNVSLVANQFTIDSYATITYPAAGNTSTIAKTGLNRVVVPNGGSHDIPNFSGMILINDLYDGGVYMWLAGSTITVLAANTRANEGTFSFNGGIGGYTWNNANNLIGPFTFTVISTRSGA
jgi:hypothetical protein